MAKDDHIARYLNGLRGGTVTKTDGPAIRQAKANAQMLLREALSLDFAALDSLLMRAPIDAQSLALVVHLAALYGGSERQRKAAKAKNEKARAYVLAQWLERGDQRKSKAAFAREYVGVVRRKFGTCVKAETIARDWLPSEADERASRPAVGSAGAHAWTGRYHVARKA